MKKVLMVFGGIFLGLSVIAVITIGTLLIKGTALDKESKAYVEKVVPIVCADLRWKTLEQYASTELINANTPEKFEEVFTWLRTLGQFKECKSISGQATLNYDLVSGKTVSGDYLANIEFETGPASVQIKVLKENNEWKVLSFHVTSDALLPKAASQNNQDVAEPASFVHSE